MWVLLLPVHLPEYDPVAPDVAGVGEGAEVDALRGVPLDGPAAARLGPVVVPVTHHPGQTEVGDLRLVFGGEQDIPRRCKDMLFFYSKKLLFDPRMVLGGRQDIPRRCKMHIFNFKKTG